VIPPNFEYYAPGTLDEAVRLLDQHSGDAKVLAGGQSLIAMMKLRLAQPRILVDINRIPNLDFAREDGDWLRIGALTRTNTLATSDLIRTRYPMLAEAANDLADPIVRNMGTVGGNVSHGDPGNDLPACMLSMGAQYVLHGPKGERTVPALGYYQDTFVTIVEPNEVLKEVQVPKARAGAGGAYFKMERKVGDFAITAVAAHVALGPNKEIQRAGIGLTNVGPTVIFAKAASDSLRGHMGTAEDVDKAAGLARDASDPSPDGRGPVAFKKDMVRVWTRRALTRALARAKGGN
jgi:carbon-monoxide dehydrogenase medium subunit